MTPILASRPGAITTGIAVALLTGAAAVACSEQQSGTPLPSPDSTGISQTAPTATTTTGPSVDDLDLCALLTPDDLPIQPKPDDRVEQELIWDGDGCELTIQLSNPFDVLVAGVTRWDWPFQDFIPPGDGGEFTTIAGRAAYVGPGLSAEGGCVAGFGAADGMLTVTLENEILDAAPCETVVGLAEIVIARTPPPNE